MRSTRRIRNNPVFQAIAEVLENRRLLCSTHLAYLPKAPEWSESIEAESASARAGEGGPEAIDIVWTNRGQNSDNFGLAFGTSAEAGRNVVDAALAAWERVITSFNRSDGTNTLQLTISIATDVNGNLVGGFGGAGGPAAAAPLDGKPRTGSITINAGSIVANTPNDSNGWFFDPTPNDYSEFDGAILNPFSGNPSSFVGGEMFAVVSAEITHTLGLISPKAGGGGSNWVGYELIDSGFTQATGQRDNAEGGNTSGFFYVFNGPSISHAMTSFNSGDSDSDSWGNVIHTAGGTANFTHNGVNYRGTDDDGNAASGGERNLPSWVTANILKDAYGYTIENPAKFGTMMAILNQNTGRLTVRGIDNSADTIFITSNGAITTVHVDLGTDFPGSGFRPGTGNLDAWVSEFPTGAVQSIVIDAGTGDDVVNLDLPGNIPITVSGGAGGNDLLLIKGSAGYDNINVDFPIITSSSLNVQNFSDFEQLRIDTRTGNADLFLPDLLGSMTGVTVQGDSGNETINLHSLEAAKPAVFFMGSGNDTVNVQTDFGAGLVASPVTINGFDGDDVVNVGPVDFAGTIVTQPITFNGDGNEDSLVLGSNNADSISATMTFNGGTGINDRIIFNDQAPSYNIDYDIRPTFINRVGFSNYNVNYSATDRITINGGGGADSVIVRNTVAPTVEAFGNGGNDTFTRGDGIITASSVANFNGGPGVDQITFDDHLNTGNIIFDCRQNEIFYGGLITQITTGFESVGILAGSGQNEITFNQTLTQNFNVDAGPGTDTIIFGFNGGTATIQGTVNVNGGDGTDAFQLNNVNTSGAGNVTINGGNDLNSLSVARPGTLLYDIGAGFLNMFSFGSSAHINTANLESASISGNSLAESFNIFSASSLFGQYQVFGNNGDDTFNLIQPDGSNFSFNNLQLNGGAGTDTFVYDATAVTGPGVYSFANNILSVSRGGIFSDNIGVGSAIENVTFNGGSGNDFVRVDQYSAGNALRLNLGGGDDTLRYGNNNLQANLTNASLFQVNGGDGFDTAHVDNLNNALSWNYTTNAATFVSADNDPFVSYSWTMSHSNLDNIVVHAGLAGDGLSVREVPTGQRIEFFGNEGNDSANWLNTLTGIRGPVYFNGEGGNNTISNLNSTDAAGQILHLTQDSIGAFPGDNYFGPGGAVYFTDVSSILLTTGNGPDTVFAQPNATATVTIRATNPTTSPGDTLNLAMAAAGNYTVAPGSFGSFDVTSDNAAILTYSAFEDGPFFDAVAPAVVANDFNFNLGAPRGVAPMEFTATFSEDVSALLSGGFLELFNTTTNSTVPASDIAVEWDATNLVATFTFPNYAGGLLPDGVYQARVLPGLADQFGNASAAGEYYTFIWSAGTAENDRFRVARAANLTDIEVYLNDDVTPTFLAGDGTAKVVLLGGLGDDEFELDMTNSDPTPTIDGIEFIGSDGSDSVLVRGSANADVVSFFAEYINPAANLVTTPGIEQKSYIGGGGDDAIFVYATNVNLPVSQRFGTLSLDADAQITVTAGLDGVITTLELALPPAARLDLGQSAMIVDYATTSPLTEVRDALITGRNGGAWDGAGINSSAAAGDSSLAIGYAEASSLFSSFPATFAGEQVDDTAVLLRLTLLGDANLDRTVNISDFASLAANFNQPDTLWKSGDFDYSGTTNISDFSVLASRFNQTLPPGIDARALSRQPSGKSIFSNREVVEESLLDELT